MCILNCNADQDYSPEDNVCVDKCDKEGGWFWNSETKECVDSACDSRTYFLDDPPRCVACTKNCSDCVEGVCQGCDSGFYLEQKSLRAVCTSRCPTAGTYWNEALQSCMSVCQDGQYFNASDEGCYDCIEGCLQCSSATTCQVCGPLPQVASSNGKCEDICSRNETTWNEELKAC
mmetsp:Transcript_18048/g.13080  ORF Transcript_18048/g.13080 Transcript_18048/m.13080 type:complete len:175 (-) Transcript_18048:23-547(-)